MSKVKQAVVTRKIQLLLEADNKEEWTEKYQLRLANQQKNEDGMRPATALCSRSPSAENAG